MLSLFIANLNGIAIEPQTNKRAIIELDEVRFSILTPRVIRMEWDPNSAFNDNASFIFVNRNVPVPHFTHKEENGWLCIQTDFLELRYKISSGRFSADNLTITYHDQESSISWKPGDQNTGNLLGTMRTLDNSTAKYDSTLNTYVYGPGKDGRFSPLSEGILSRKGWTLIDDSKTPLFDTSDYPWALERKKGEHEDAYFFAYGSNYKAALADYTLLAGKIPIPPKYAFGVWWSKWWSYTDTELKALVNEYRDFGVPLDVLVIDMDWHLTDIEPLYSGKNLRSMYPDSDHINPGWTGYTWNKTYFPDYKNFLNWTNEKNIQTCLNLHPADGILPHESMYPEMAKAMGVDTTGMNNPVKFNIVDKKFTTNYMKRVLNPYEDAGVDFWWNDWQQWDTTSIAGVTPTFYLNYVHFSDMARRNKRPLVFHRWGGLGNHRYPIGFSGDSYINWNTLEALPYYTFTAANVGYGYWSHDVGGFFQDSEGDMHLSTDPELFTRWVQMASLSPIYRTHAVKIAEVKRKIWEYPLDYFTAMKKAIKFRYSLFPYFYTAARKAYDTGLSINRPMYYDYPTNDEAYRYKGQYMLGDEILVSPILSPYQSETTYKKERKTKIDQYNKQLFIGFGTNISNDQLEVISRQIDEHTLAYEIGIKWDGLSEDFAITSGTTIGFDLYLGDNDGKGIREGIIAWNTNKPMNSKNPLHNGLLLLEQQSQQNAIAHTNTTPVIDGIMEESWQSITPSTINHEIVRNPSITKASWRAQWDEDMLYLFVEVTDDAIYSPPANQPWEGDGLELYLDLNPMVNQTFSYQLSEKTTWLPEGKWYEWTTGKLIDGGIAYRANYPINCMPVFVKENAIIPQQPEMLNLMEKSVDPLIINVFPGNEDKSYHLYDDDGQTQNYQSAGYAFTEITKEISGTKQTITIRPIHGSFEGMLKYRAYEIRLVLSYPPKQVRINGKPIKWSSEPIENSWNYDGEKFTTIISTPGHDVTQPLRIDVELPDADIELLSGAQTKIRCLQQLSKQLLDLDKKIQGYKWTELVDLSQAGNRISLNPNLDDLKKEIKQLNAEYLIIQNKLYKEGKFDLTLMRVAKLLETGI